MAGIITLLAVSPSLDSDDLMMTSKAANVKMTSVIAMVDLDTNDTSMLLESSKDCRRNRPDSP